MYIFNVTKLRGSRAGRLADHMSVSTVTPSSSFNNSFYIYRIAVLGKMFFLLLFPPSDSTLTHTLNAVWAIVLAIAHDKVDGAGWVTDYSYAI